MFISLVVIPAYAGMDCLNHWIPACAGMTEVVKIKTIKVVNMHLSLRRHSSLPAAGRRRRLQSAATLPLFVFPARAGNDECLFCLSAPPGVMPAERKYNKHELTAK